MEGEQRRKLLPDYLPSLTSYTMHIEGEPLFDQNTQVEQDVLRVPSMSILYSIW